jgi:hypothetical protein
MSSIESLSLTIGYVVKIAWRIGGRTRKTGITRRPR